MYYKKILFAAFLTVAFSSSLGLAEEKNVISSVSGKEYTRIFLKKDPRNFSDLVKKYPALHPDYIPPDVTKPPETSPELPCSGVNCDLYTYEASGPKGRLMMVVFRDLPYCDYRVGCSLSVYLDKGQGYEPVVITGANPFDYPLYLEKDWDSVLVCRETRETIFRAEHKFNIKTPGRSYIGTDFSKEKNLLPCADPQPTNSSTPSAE